MRQKRFQEFLHNSEGIGNVSLVIFTIVDLVLVIVFFMSLGVDWATTAALVVFGAMASLGKLWARIEWAKRTIMQVARLAYCMVWAAFTVVTFFGGIMFMLTTVQVQSDAPPVPEYVERSRAEYTDAIAYLDELRAMQSQLIERNQRTNAATYDGRIATQSTLVEQRESALRSVEATWKEELVSATDKIKALAVFNRIPLVLSQPNPAIIIALLFFVVAFGGLEAVLFVMGGRIGELHGFSGDPQERINDTRAAANEGKPVDVCLSEPDQPLDAAPTITEGVPAAGVVVASTPKVALPHWEEFVDKAWVAPKKILYPEDIADSTRWPIQKVKYYWETLFGNQKLFVRQDNSVLPLGNKGRYVTGWRTKYDA